MMLRFTRPMDDGLMAIEYIGVTGTREAKERR
jgi:hypothetical protein